MVCSNLNRCGNRLAYVPPSAQMRRMRKSKEVSSFTSNNMLTSIDEYKLSVRKTRVFEVAKGVRSLNVQRQLKKKLFIF